MAVNPVSIPPRATSAAWDLVETLTFARTAGRAALSVAKVAQAVGVTYQSMHAWEEGAYLPGLAAFVAWADTLGFDVALIPREE